MIKKTIKALIADIFYGLYICFRAKKHPIVKVMSVDDTIEVLTNSNKSLVRFGDGELTMIRGYGLHFQENNKELSDELTNIIKYDDEKLIVSVQDIFEGLDMYVPESRKFWKDHFLFYHNYYKRLCNPRRVYASTSFSRCYITIQDKSKCKEWFEKTRKIWANKNVVVVEGTVTHNGVGNDLLDTALCVKRIICPSRDAYVKLKDIENECFKLSKDNLFLVSLGPTAKPLVRDLFQHGYRAIDIGQLDYEYELFLAGASKKNLEIGKHKVISMEENIKSGYSQYIDEIIAKID